MKNNAKLDRAFGLLFTLMAFSQLYQLRYSTFRAAFPGMSIYYDVIPSIIMLLYGIYLLFRKEK